MKLENLKIAFEGWFFDAVATQLSFAEQIMVGIVFPSIVEEKLKIVEEFLSKYNLLSESGEIDETLIMERLDKFVFKNGNEFKQRILSKDFSFSRKNLEEIIQVARAMDPRR